jgi:beta-lactamase regulating signal transducer with metallopeptidase domain
MTGFSQSALLQALGWATLNSFWQAGALWCAYLLLRRFTLLSPGQQYKFAVASLLLSAAGFFSSIFFFLQGDVQFSGPFSVTGAADNYWFSTILTAASVSYLLLLFVPATRLVQNWRFLRRLRRSQLAKAPVQYRLYVQKIAGRLGIRKTVQVHLSALVQSPVTIGYLKPLILLPVASFNQLTTQQAEAILLHELAHIRRFDYLVNIAISLIQTILYFNPFVRLFVRTAENGRERCCDGLVLQFGYDPFAYAGALLHLEKSAAPLPQFALGATGKNQLFSRIEAIVGIPGKMPVLKLYHFTGLLASVLFVLALHSLLMSEAKKEGPGALQTLAYVGNPFDLVYQEDFEEAPVTNAPAQTTVITTNHTAAETTEIIYDVLPAEEPLAPPPPPEAEQAFLQIAHIEEPMDQLAEEEQQQVAATVATTKEVLSTLQWKELEKEIADGLTAAEKQHTFEQYQKEVAQLNWKEVERNLASRYKQTNWDHLNQYLESATIQMRLDSAETAICKSIAELTKMTRLNNGSLFPDLSSDSVNTYKIQLQQTLDSIKMLRKRPTIRL